MKPRIFYLLSTFCYIAIIITLFTSVSASSLSPRISRKIKKIFKLEKTPRRPSSTSSTSTSSTSTTTNSETKEAEEEKTFYNVPPPTKVREYTNNQLYCRLKSPCNFYKKVLLVIKLNPVRLLWLDLLLRFYSTGFENIVFYAPLEKNTKPLKQKKRMKKIVKKEQEQEQEEGKLDDGGEEEEGEKTTSSLPYFEIIRIGQYDTKVILIDDNYGFCDHQTIAASMQLYRQNKFEGFMFLSDDVLFEFWRFTDSKIFDKKRVWRQETTKNPIQRENLHKEVRAINEISIKYNKKEHKHEFPLVKLDFFSLPFAATSGIYFVPNFLLLEPKFHHLHNRFIKISDILLKHRTYNEVGTPTLLLSVDAGNFCRLRGLLVWGLARNLLVKSFPKSAHNLWFHPVRASGEFFARVSYFVWSRILQQEKKQAKLLSNENSGGGGGLVVADLKYNDPDSIIESSIFFDNCFVCATHPQTDRKMKNLLHSCIAIESTNNNEEDENTDACGTRYHHNDNKKSKRKTNLNQVIEETSQKIKELWPIMGGTHVAKFVSGRIIVSNSSDVRANRDGIICSLEIKHEGFWNEKVVREIFDELYPFLNHTKIRSKSLATFPECCVIKP